MAAGGACEPQLKPKHLKRYDLDSGSGRGLTSVELMSQQEGGALTAAARFCFQTCFVRFGVCC